MCEREDRLRPCVSFDFDGVCHEHPGWRPCFGAVDVAVIELVQDHGYAAAVSTCNDPDRVAAELERHGVRTVLDPQMRILFWDGGPDGREVLVTCRKVVADAYVDDKALHWRFGRDPAIVLRRLEEMAAWRKREAA